MYVLREYMVKLLSEAISSFLEASSLNQLKCISAQYQTDLCHTVIMCVYSWPGLKMVIYIKWLMADTLLYLYEYQLLSPSACVCDRGARGGDIDAERNNLRSCSPKRSSCLSKTPHGPSPPWQVSWLGDLGVRAEQFTNELVKWHDNSLLMFVVF